MRDTPQTTVSAVMKMGAADVLDTIANLSNDEVFTPPKLANQVLDLLPKHVWSDSSLKFLDPCVKTGVFLREIVKRLMVGLQDEFPDVVERREHILRNQIYGIAITELTALMSRRTVYCSSDATREPNPNFPENCFSAVKFDEPEGNIAFPLVGHKWPEKKGVIAQKATCDVCGANYKQFAGQDREGMESYAYPFIHMNINEIWGKEMKFDVVVGNPPYQMNDGGGNGSSSGQIYHHFVNGAKKLSPDHLVMITPSRWFTGGKGKGVEEFRSTMISDRSIEHIIDFPKLFDCFPGVEIKGGVSIFHINSRYDGDCFFEKRVDGATVEKTHRDLREGGDVVLRDASSSSILNKVVSDRGYMDTEFYPRNPFGLLSKFRGSNEPSAEGMLKLYRQGGIDHVERDVVSKNDNIIDVHKVFIAKAADGHGRIPAQVTGSAFPAMPGEICTETYLCIGPYSTIYQAENCATFMKTKFCRFLVSLRKITHNMTGSSYSFVPRMDFEEIWTDEKLYSKFGLTEDEIDFIESSIKAMP